MPFSAGVYTLPTPALVPGQTVASTENNTSRNDFATALNLTMLRNGTSVATANLPMGGYKLTGLGVATTSGDALSYAQEAVLAESVISVNSSSDALRITQVGSGNALVVEDSANPDSTPFVIDANGRVIDGSATALSFAGATPQLQIHSTVSTQSAISGWSATSGLSPLLNFYRSASGVVGTQGAVASGYDLGAFNFYGDDGTAFIPSAQILAEVDGTPGTNDMPGRLVFSTTADGASSPTERMRIDSTGAVGIGTTNLGAGYGLRVSKSLLVDSGACISSSANGTASTPTGMYSFRSTVATDANGGTPYTITNVYSYVAAQGTFNTDSTVTNQYGFFANSSLTGATNNYGFTSQIAAGTGRYNFYASGTASNYMAGALGIGNASVPNFNLRLSKTITGSTSSYGAYCDGQIQSDVTTAYVFATSATTAASAFTLGTLAHFHANQSTIGAGSTVTNQYGFLAQSGLTGATNNFGFYGAIASGTNRYNFVASGTAPNYFIGNTSFGVNITGGGASGHLRIGYNATGSTSTRAVYNSSTALSDVTSLFEGYATGLSTAASAFTLTNMFHFSASQGTIGAGSTLSNQIGFNVGSSLTGATNNYGFASAIAAGTGRYNFYASGTAANVFIGNTAIGTSTTSAALLTVSGSSSVAALKVNNIKEVITVSATAATGTINYDIATQAVLYYTTNASANWTLNFRGSSGTSLDTLMATGESMSVTFMATQGATAYYNSAVTIDGAAVTPKWQGGTAPSAGNINSIDAYTYVIIKTGTATFTVLASVTKFA